MGKLTQSLKAAGILAFVGLGSAMIFFSLPGSGWKALSVQTGSMEPEIPKGALVFVSSVPADSLKIGDVITYKSREQSGQTVTHRITREVGVLGGPERFVTKGDANRSSDPLVYENQIVGKVTHASAGLGTALDFIKTPLGLALFVYLPALLLAVIEVRLLVRRLTRIEIDKQQKLLSDSSEGKMPTAMDETNASIARSKKIRVMDGLSVLAVVAVLGAVGIEATYAELRASTQLTGNSISVLVPAKEPELEPAPQLPVVVPEPPVEESPGDDGTPPPDTEAEAQDPVPLSPMSGVLIVRVDIDDNARDERHAGRTKVTLYGVDQRTNPDMKGWRLENASGMLYKFDDSSPAYVRGHFDIWVGSDKLKIEADHLTLKDEEGKEVDSIEWGRNDNRQSQPHTPKLKKDMVLERADDYVFDSTVNGSWSVKVEAESSQQSSGKNITMESEQSIEVRSRFSQRSSD